MCICGCLHLTSYGMPWYVHIMPLLCKFHIPNYRLLSLRSYFFPLKPFMAYCKVGLFVGLIASNCLHISHEIWQNGNTSGTVSQTMWELGNVSSVPQCLTYSIALPLKFRFRLAWYNTLNFCFSYWLLDQNDERIHLEMKQFECKGAVIIFIYQILGFYFQFLCFMLVTTCKPPRAIIASWVVIKIIQINSSIKNKLVQK